MKRTNGPDARLWLESDLNGFERGAIDKRCLFSAGRHSCWPLMWWKVSQSQSLKMFLRVLPHKSALCCWEDFFPLTLFRDVSAWKRLNTWLQKKSHHCLKCNNDSIGLETNKQKTLIAWVFITWGSELRSVLYLHSQRDWKSSGDTFIFTAMSQFIQPL